jgi:hypothetical protein
MESGNTRITLNGFKKKHKKQIRNQAYKTQQS